MHRRADGLRPPAVACRWRGFTAALLLSCCSLPGAAAGPEVHGEERAQLLERLRAQQQGIRSVRAAVVQRKRHPLLKEEAVSEGTLLLQRPHRLRWEVTRPHRLIILIEGDTLLIYRPDRQEAERRDLREDFVSRAAANFLTATMDLSPAELEKRFQVEVHREAGRTLLVLTPRSPLIAQVVASATVFLQDGDAVPRSIVVMGQKGDRTETTLSHVIVNPSVPEDAFALRLGPEVQVKEWRRPAGEVAGGR